MARKKKVAEAPTGVKVEWVPIQGRRLITYEPDSGAWMSPARDYQAGPLVKGAIVRLRPPAGAEARVEELRVELMREGAERVVVVPPPRADVVPREVAERSAPAASIRQVVLGMVAESNSGDRGKLGEFVEAVMGEVGL
jgi:hypothetical protein